ncbi:MAG: hypothetical protein WDM92_06200 [Caulobacteraceae bacterium]
MQAFAAEPALTSGLLTPVFSARDGYQPAAVTPLQDNPLLNAFLPDRWCYRPKRPGYISPAGFREAGLPDFRGLGWEEFLWRGAPFAVHVRGELQRGPAGGVEDDAVGRGLDAVLRRLGQPPLDPLGAAVGGGSA